ncbi:uncharacterized protein B0P05DRAFT_537897 [Gilbertella persicaria]|uniref:uncharacterized protein n=1 Tax=Gilbertella persicaria TaxID=101096 RepID=UPI00221FEEB5|nr:uncharacterized protein B0P05DRAFT_537897 [Gilbertella persicaria]KAI8082652.1 hypothetical protein B0P05DRAFT_537897 [Gilbertella persicaria]
MYIFVSFLFYFFSNLHRFAFKAMQYSRELNDNCIELDRTQQKEKQLEQVALHQDIVSDNHFLKNKWERHKNQDQWNKSSNHDNEQLYFKAKESTSTSLRSLNSSLTPNYSLNNSTVSDLNTYLYQPYPTLPRTTTYRHRLTTTLWEDENTICYQVDCRGICVARRQDNDMINGTKLLNVAGMSRGKRDGILKNEKGRVVVKIGAMHLKGVWISIVRAKTLASQFKILDTLYPLFSDDPTVYLYPSHFRQMNRLNQYSRSRAASSFHKAYRNYSSYHNIMDDNLRTSFTNDPSSASNEDIYGIYHCHSSSSSSAVPHGLVDLYLQDKDYTENSAASSSQFITKGPNLNSIANSSKEQQELLGNTKRHSTENGVFMSKKASTDQEFPNNHLFLP